MSSNSSIEWTDTTWNPTTGCDRVSPGCDRCYALTMAKRLKGMGSEKYQNDGDPKTSGPGFLAVKHADTLTAPLRWRKPRKVFVNSMSDLFHERISDEFISRVFAVMARTPQHTYQVLTKRHARMRSLLSSEKFKVWTWAAQAEGQGGCTTINDVWPLPNVWLGVSVEDQKWANTRIPALIDTPAAIRFLSCEPLLGPVDLSQWLPRPFERQQGGYWLYTPETDVYGNGKQWMAGPAIGWQGTAEELAAAKADAEARGATHVYASWAHEYNHDLYEPTAKPWSVERVDPLDDHQAPMRKWGKHAAGRLLDGREWNQFPEVST